MFVVVGSYMHLAFWKSCYWHSFSLYFRNFKLKQHQQFSLLVFIPFESSLIKFLILTALKKYAAIRDTDNVFNAYEIDTSNNSA